MAFNETLAGRIREALTDQPMVEEKKMFQGLGFMVEDKLFICVNANDMLCRIGEKNARPELEKGTCRQMIHNGRAMKNFVSVDIADVQTERQLGHWISLYLSFNKEAKSSRKKAAKS